MEYNRTLLENDIPVQPSFHTQLIKLILQNKDYPTLHSLIQYHVLADSLELARILINIGEAEDEGRYEPAWQLGMDMLGRLRRYDEVVQIFVKKHMVHVSLADNTLVPQGH